MKCSPHFLEKGKVITTSRIETQSKCDENCAYYKCCLIELNGGSKRIAKLGVYSEYDDSRKYFKDQEDSRYNLNA
jgi:hypothetical protein